MAARESLARMRDKTNADQRCLLVLRGVGETRRGAARRELAARPRDTS